MPDHLNRLIDVVLASVKQIDSDLVGHVECVNPNTVMCLLRSRKERTPWPWMVAKFTRTRDSFSRRRTFTNMTEAWKFFVDASELFCLTEDNESGVTPTRIKPRPRGDSHGRKAT